MTLIDSAVDEILRWTSPLHHMSRRAVADVTIRGETIHAGDSVLTVPNATIAGVLIDNLGSRPPRSQAA